MSANQSKNFVTPSLQQMQQHQPVPSNLCWRLRHLPSFGLKTEHVHPKGSETVIHISVLLFSPLSVSLQKLRRRCQNIPAESFPAVSLPNAKGVHPP